MEYGAQRGSVADMPTYPGDPLTPFIGATEDAERLTIAEAPTIMKIPVLPISYANALPLLEAIEGPVAPPSWRGGLPITYHLGPGPAKVRVKLEFDWSLQPAYNVIATMEGSEFPDQWVMRGNHHDAWVFGASDPLSGMVVTLEEARAIGELAKTGWRPKRTIKFAAWDAEEPGLLGSTEWAEHHADEIREKMVVYINTDGTGRGFLNTGGSHSLERIVNQVAKEVYDPETGVTLWDRLEARFSVNNTRQHGVDLPISALGSGSDYTPFLQHLGISSLNVGMGGESGGGSYHSTFDSYDHYSRFIDPGFEYGATLAKVTGRLTLRFANADVLPHRFTNYASTVSDYVEQVAELANEMRAETERHNELVASGAFDLAADPRKDLVTPDTKDPVPFINFAPLQNSAARLATASDTYDERIGTALMGTLDRRAATELNALIIYSERALSDDAGLPKRPWFRHTIYAPGLYTGYGVKTLPGVREAIEQREWDLVDAQMSRIANALNALAELLERSSAVMGTGDLVP
jgi:N-acetylated-alpha-linked acidic dipeptidase